VYYKLNITIIHYDKYKFNEHAHTSEWALATDSHIYDSLSTI